MPAARRTNRGRVRMDKKRAEAIERQEARNALTNKQQLAQLDKYSHAAVKERKRLTKER